jgi:hypothetical protein
LSWREPSALFEHAWHNLTTRLIHISEEEVPAMKHLESGVVWGAVLLIAGTLKLLQALSGGRG